MTAGTGDTISLTAGTGDKLSGAGFIVHAGSGVGFSVKGSGDILYAGLNDAIDDGGSSTLFRIAANVGSLAISGFKADTTGVIDLMKGVGGYSTAAAAFAALKSDGSGGSLLSLGADGSIDFKGDPVSSLSASNFKIG